MNSKTPTTYATMTEALRYLNEKQLDQPSLSDLANHLNLSESYVQRQFAQWVGVSPKQYLQFLTKEHAKRQLLHNTVLDSALNVGLSGSGRLHDLLVKTEGMTPGEYKARGKSMVIYYGYFTSLFGPYLLACTPRSVCELAFFDTNDEKDLLIQALERKWPLSEVIEDQSVTENFANKIFHTPETDNLESDKLSLSILLKGTAFQIQVWEALLKIPYGNIMAYQSVADALNKPQSVRAVASAIAKNNVGYIIPCHRVIRANGEFNHYRWGRDRKQMLLAWESARNQSES